jgi:hypothetical protein
LRMILPEQAVGPGIQIRDGPFGIVR